MSNQNQARETIATGMHPTHASPPVWQVIDGLVDYTDCLRHMEKTVSDIHSGNARETILLVEHPALYTGGTSAQNDDLLDASRFPVFQTGRGGEFTYHGPGQRVVYPMLDLSRRKQDVRLYVATLEQWIINTLDQLNIKGERREDRVGVWVTRADKPPLTDGTPREDKIAAIGIRIRKWVTFHGVSLNVEPDLDHYSGIVACGVEGHGITSLADLGHVLTMEDVDVVLRQEFEKLFGETD